MLARDALFARGRQVDAPLRLRRRPAATTTIRKASAEQRGLGADSRADHAGRAI